MVRFVALQHEPGQHIEERLQPAVLEAMPRLGDSVG
jgi:hypothetical protein